MTAEARRIFIEAATTAFTVVMHNGTDEEILAVLYDLAKRAHIMKERDMVTTWGAALIDHASGVELDEKGENVDHRESRWPAK